MDATTNQRHTEKLPSDESDKVDHLYFSLSIDNELTSLNNGIFSKHEQLTQQINNLKIKALQYPKPTHTRILLNPLRDKIYDFEIDSEKETPSKDMPSASKFIPIK